MPDPKKLGRWIGELEAVADWARQRVRGDRGGGPFRILPFRGHGTATHIRLRGRVLEGEAIPAASQEDSAIRNFLHTLKRIETAEVPAARVRARIAGCTFEALSDDDGYYTLDAHLPAGLPAGTLWHEVDMELLDPVGEGHAPGRSQGLVLVPPRGAEFGVISDIDDTVVKTDVANLLSMARLVLLTNAHTRLPFEGVSAFYRALHSGPSGGHLNPVFYVSSSPWNFYDLLEEVLAVHQIPVGPLFLKDYGLSHGFGLSTGHHQHKLGAIEEILTTHSDLSFVLIGDSGQHDPEIYREVVRKHPGRVRAIYIRDVSAGERDAGVLRIADEVRAQGVEMLITGDTVTAATHAAALGLIDPASLGEIRGDKAADEAAPGPIESVLE